MYKLTLGSINEIKSSSEYSGTIEKDRVVLVGDSGYLQVDGNFGASLVPGLTMTLSASLDDDKAIYYWCEKYEDENLNTAALYVWDGHLFLQSDFDDEDAFIEHLVDEGYINIQGYENPVYELSTATIKEAGDDYEEEEIVVTVPGRAGDTAGTVTCTVTIPEGDTKGAITAVEVTTAGEYAVKVASQDIEVPGGSGVITVTMTKA